MPPLQVTKGPQAIREFRGAMHGNVGNMPPCPPLRPVARVEAFRNGRSSGSCI